MRLEERMPEVREKARETAGRDVPDEAILPFVGVAEDYLHAAYTTMRENNGSPLGYAAEVLGVTQQMQADLRARYIV